MKVANKLGPDIGLVVHLSRVIMLVILHVYGLKMKAFYKDFKLKFNKFNSSNMLELLVFERNRVS